MRLLRIASLAIALIASYTGSAKAQVNLADYGFGDDVAAAAYCVQKRLSSHSTTAVAHRYWHPVTLVGGFCQRPRDHLGHDENERAKAQFLYAYGDCSRRKLKDDTDLFVAKVADAVSVLAASGVINQLTGETLLDKFNKGSHACNKLEDTETPKQKLARRLGLAKPGA